MHCHGSYIFEFMNKIVLVFIVQHISLCSSRTFNAPSNVSDLSFLQMLWPIPKPKSETFLSELHHDFLPPLCNISLGTCSKDVMLYENVLITYCLKASLFVTTSVQLLLYTVSVVMHHSQP